MNNRFIDILKQFALDIEPAVYGNGHINDTYIVHAKDGDCILQKINKNVFKNPPAVMENIKDITEFFLFGKNQNLCRETELSLLFPGISQKLVSVYFRN